MPADPNQAEYQNAPQQGGGQNDQLEQIREALVGAIRQHLTGPQPTPPQYQPQTLTPLQGFAEARNPQLAGQIEQGIQAPGQARYAQQQAAFEAAMQGRHEAMTGGLGLLNLQGKQDQQDIMNQLRMMGLAIQEQRAKDAENKPTNPQSDIVYDAQGRAFRSPKSGGPASPIMLPGGEQAGKQNSENTVAVRTNLDRVRQDLTDLKNAYAANISETPNQYQRAGQQVLQDIPIAREFGSKTARDFRSLKQELILSLPNLFGAGKRITQFEVQRLEQILPDLASGGEFTEDTINRFMNELNRIAETRGALQPNIFNSSSASTPLTKEQIKARILAKHGVQ